MRVLKIRRPRPARVLQVAGALGLAALVAGCGSGSTASSGTSGGTTAANGSAAESGASASESSRR